MMSLDDLIALYDREQRIDLLDPRYEREVVGKVVRYLARAPGRFSFISHAQLSEAEADAVIDEQIDFFSTAGMNFEWRLCSHDQPADMKDRLRRKGFETGEAEFILVFDLEQAPERILEPKHIPGDEQGALKIERVHNNPGLQAVQELEETVWDEQMSWLFDDLSGLLRDAPNFVSIYLAYLHDKPVSAAWSFYPPGSQFVDLYGGATLEALRGKGLYTTLLAHRAQEAVQRGRRYLIVDAGEMSRPILIKRGFQVLVTFYTCEWKINM